MRSGTAVLAAVVVAMTALLAAFGALVYPVPMTDSTAFVPAAVAVARGAGLVNPLYHHPALAGSDGRYTYHAPLFPLVLGWLVSPWGTARAAFVAIALLRGGCLALAAVLFWRAARPPEGGPPTRFAVALSALALVGLGTYGMPAEGRPEVLATLLLLAGTLATLSISRPVLRSLAQGLLLALLAACHPVGAVMAVPLVALHAFTTARPPAAAGRLLATGAVAAGAFALVMARTPYGLAESLAGMRYFARAVVVPGGWDAFSWRFFTIAGPRTFCGPLLVVAAWASAALLARRGAGRPATPAGAWLALALFWALAVYFAVRTPTRLYNVLLFAPLLYCAAIRWVTAAWVGVPPETRLAGRRPHTKTRLGRHTDPLKVVVLVTFALTGLGFLRYLVIFPAFAVSGTPLSEARREIAPALEPGQRVWMDFALWILADESRYRDLRCPITPDLAPEPGSLVVANPGSGELRAALAARGWTVRQAARDAPAGSGPWGGTIPGWARGYRFEVWAEPATP